MKKSEKIFLVQDLTARLTDAKGIVLVDTTGLKVPEQQKLRQMLKEVGATIHVVKNTLLKRAVQASNFKHQASNLELALTGQTAIVIAQKDEVTPIQAIGRFIKKFEMPRLKIGVLGENLYSEASLIHISKLPGREVLIGQLLGILNGPAYGMVGVLQANMGKLVYILQQKSKA